jgi:hypothetical protein
MTANAEQLTAAAPRADGVEYFSFPGATGQFFLCAAYRAKLSTTACAKRWREAQKAEGHAANAIERCRGCAIGASHAGEKAVHYSILYGTGICHRCGRGGLRLIGGARCVSCANCQYEFIKGRNAKGSRPTMAPLQRRTIRYAVAGGSIESMTIDYSADLLELMILALRKTRGRIIFHFNSGQPASQTEALS